MTQNVSSIIAVSPDHAPSKQLLIQVAGNLSQNRILHRRKKSRLVKCDVLKGNLVLSWKHVITPSDLANVPNKILFSIKFVYVLKYLTINSHSVNHSSRIDLSQ
jgi:hypothetical protein